MEGVKRPIPGPLLSGRALLLKAQNQKTLWRDSTRSFLAYLVGAGGFEPPTSAASRQRSPAELRAFPVMGESKISKPLKGVKEVAWGQEAIGSTQRSQFTGPGPALSSYGVEFLFCH